MIGHAFLARERLEALDCRVHQRPEIQPLALDGLREVFRFRVGEEVLHEPVELIRLLAADGDIARRLLRRVREPLRQPDQRAAQREEGRAQVVGNRADEETPLLLEFRLPRNRVAQSFAHRLEGVPHIGDLAHPRGRQGEVEIAARDPPRRPPHRLERLHDGPPDPPARMDDGEHQRDGRRRPRQTVVALRGGEFYRADLLPAIEDRRLPTDDALPGRMPAGIDVPVRKISAPDGSRRTPPTPSVLRRIPERSLPLRVVPVAPRSRRCSAPRCRAHCSAWICDAGSLQHTYGRSHR